MVVRVKVGCWFAILLAVSQLAGTPAEGSDLTKFLREMFSDMSGREPTGSELNYHAELNRQGGSLENAIVLFGSDEVYLTQTHGDPNLYVDRMYETFLGRDPRPDEQSFWVSQMQQSGYRRADMVRWFCQSNHITQLPSFLPTPPSYYPPSNEQQIALQLVERTNLLLNFLTAELGQTYFGNGVIEQGQRLFALSKQYRNVLQSSGGTQGQSQIVVNNLASALQDLESRYYKVPGSSSQSKQVLQQVSQLVAAAQSANSGWNRPPNVSQLPQAPQSPVSPVSPAAASEINRLLDESRRFAYGLLGYQNQSPFYANLSRDVQGLSTQVESLALMVRQGQSLPALQQSMWSIVDQARHISQDVGRADTNIQRGWWNVQSQLRTTAQSLGVNSDFNIQPSRPVVIDNPAWVGFPYQPSPVQPPSNQEDCVVLTDQLIGKIDSYSQALAPIAGVNPNAASLLRSMQDFKYYVLIFRQSATGGTFTTSLSSSADQIMVQYQQLAREVTQLVSRDPTLNSPLFYQIGELVQKIRLAASGRQF